jgi:hypothetical protein
MGLSGSLLQQERSEYPANNPFCVFVQPGLFVCHTPVPLPLRPELAFEHETFSHNHFFGAASWPGLAREVAAADLVIHLVELPVRSTVDIYFLTPPC